MKQILTALLLALTFNSQAMAQQKTIKIRVVETSDVHGCFFPYDFINRKPKAGSLARVSSYVDSLRQEYNDRLILLDNGDLLQGQPTCYYYNYINTKARNVASDVLNYMKYDAETFGNHDVETGHAVYDKWVSELKCPVLGANIINTKTGKPYVKPYVILEREGIRIAILGMITPAIPNWLPENLWSGMRFENMVTSARQWMEYIQQNEQPDVVIGLFHSGKEGGIQTPEYDEEASMKVAREVPGFDLVLFGHDHTRHAETITNVAGKQVVCLDPANNAMSVADAEITVTIDEHQLHGKKLHILQNKSVEGKIADVTDCPVDEKMLKIFEPQIAEVDKYVSKQIGTFKNTIYSRDSYFGSSAFNDFILNLELQITHADIAFNAPLQFNSSIQAGPIRVSDMFKLYKYENMLYTMRLSGREIKNYLEMSYDLWTNRMTNADDHLLLLKEVPGNGDDGARALFQNFSYNFDSAAGIRYTVDVTKPRGEKINILSMADGSAFDMDKDYSVAVNSYRGNGGGGLLTEGAGIPVEKLNDRIIKATDKDLRFYLMEYIKKTGAICPTTLDLWKFIPEEWTVPAAKRDYKLLFKD